jgi:hypothetical protein
VRKTRSPGERKPVNPRTDRLVAMLIWVVTGLLVGLAIAIFTGSGGWIWLGIGFLVGLLAAVFRTRPTPQIEED